MLAVYVEKGFILTQKQIHFFLNISPNFAASVGFCFFLRIRTIWESGVTPELSRSCKLRNQGHYKTTVANYVERWEGQAKGSKSEDLPT
jgi:hypothetical protein